jgi:hypothetical protein
LFVDARKIVSVVSKNAHFRIRGAPIKAKSFAIFEISLLRPFR